MPVHEIRYRAYEGPLLPQVLRLAAVPTYSFRAVFTKYVATVLFGLGVVALIGMTCYLYVTNNFLLRQTLNLSNMPLVDWKNLIARLLYIQIWPCIFITVLTAPRMIAPELAHHALPIIYSRPITRTGYILGKVSASAGMLSFLTWFQVIILAILMMFIYPNTAEIFDSILGDTIPTVFAAVLSGLAIAITISLIGLACSAATKNRAFAGILFLTVYFGSGALSAFAGEIFHNDRMYFGLVDTLYDLPAVFILGDSDRSPFWVVFGIAIWWVISLVFLHWRLRPVEVHRG
ncbi:hypothetical protein KQI84_16050 [bacterium]|nr:hypothetical protein [bacterium]